MWDRRLIPIDILLMEEILPESTWHVWNPANNGIFTISTGAGFLPSTVPLYRMIHTLIQVPGIGRAFATFDGNPKAPGVNEQTVVYLVSG